MQYGTIIIKDTFQNARKALLEYKDSIIESGNAFVLVRTEYDENCNVKNDFFDVIEFGNKLGYNYINTIVVPTEKKTIVELPDNVLYIVWFAKNREKMFFNKDAMRESHIWKNVEWGKREKNYNPKGKDPGNVWIPTKDDGKGNITEHILMNLPAIINRLFACGHQENHKTLFISNNIKDSELCNENMQLLYSGSTIKPYSTPKEKLHIVNENSPVYQSNLFAKVIWGSSEKIPEIADNTVDLIVTSPPYWDLKDYFKEGQIGQEPYPEYLGRMNSVWTECYKKLKGNGSLWLNINIRVKNSKPILLPKDFINQCKKIGFYYKGILIWHKSSGIPTNDKNIVDRHEYVLVFSKGKDITISKKIYSFADYKNEIINGGLFWNINRKAGSVGKQLHPAIYPNELVSRIVQSCTEEKQIVLDPFLGSGTTLIASILANRSCYGCEYNEGFKNLIYNRIQTDVGLLGNFKLKI
jgi:DNA modification methylase